MQYPTSFSEMTHDLKRRTGTAHCNRVANAITVCVTVWLTIYRLIMNNRNNINSIAMVGLFIIELCDVWQACGECLKVHAHAP